MSIHADNALRCGCLAFAGAIALVATVYFKPNAVTWFKPTPPVGRYQIIAGRVQAVAPSEKDQATIMKLDTATGKTWVFLPLEFGTVPGGTEFYFQPNRWVEADDNWTAKQEAKNSPKQGNKPN